MDVFSTRFNFIVSVSVVWMWVVYWFLYYTYSVLWTVSDFLLAFWASGCQCLRFGGGVYVLLYRSVFAVLFFWKVSTFLLYIWRLRRFICMAFLLQYGQFTRPALCVLRVQVERYISFPFFFAPMRPLRSVKIHRLWFFFAFVSIIILPLSSSIAP